MRRCSLWTRCVAAALVTLLGAGTVLAESSQQDRAAARALFDEGRRLVKAGKIADACPKFEESQRLDPGLGTQFNLADCYEKAGKTTSAWTLFLEVASAAKLNGQGDREKVARERASQLEPKLSRLMVQVDPKAEVPGLEVRRDGSVVGKPLWGQAVPLDPGEHTVVAVAPGRKQWTTTVQVGGEGKIATVQVQELEAEAVVAPAASASASASAPPPPPPPPPPPTASTAPPPPTSPPPPTGSGSTQKTIGLVSGGVGVVALGLAAYFAVTSKSKLKDADAYCDGTKCTSQTGVDLRADAVHNADWASIASGVGALGLVGGAILYFTAPSSDAGKSGRTPAPTLIAGPTGVVLKGVW